MISHTKFNASISIDVMRVNVRRGKGIRLKKDEAEALLAYIDRLSLVISESSEATRNAIGSTCLAWHNATPVPPPGRRERGRAMARGASASPAGFDHSAGGIKGGAMSVLIWQLRQLHRGGNGAELRNAQLGALLDHIDQLNQIITECAAAAGVAVNPGASLGFKTQLPGEVRAKIQHLEAQCDLAYSDGAQGDFAWRPLTGENAERGKSLEATMKQQVSHD